MLGKKRKSGSKLQLNSLRMDEASGSIEEHELLRCILDLSREHLNSSVLGDKLITLLNQHALLKGKSMALWCVNAQNNMAIIASQEVNETAKQQLHTTINYNLQEWYWFKINYNASSHNNAHDSCVQTNIVLEKTPQYLLGISVWSASDEIEFHLATSFFKELFSLISLMLLKPLYRDLLEHSTAQQKIIEGLAVDEQQKKAYEALLRHQAIYDNVTSLPNRFYGYSQLERAITSAQKNKRKLAILFLDLDEFKHINDSMNHMVGDVLLRILAERYLSLMRPTDTLVRLGGDEFMIILEDLAYDQYAEELAQKCQELCLTPFKLELQEVLITSSIGIALYPEHGHDAKTLMRNADAAMYQSKVRGKNNWTVFINTMGEAATHHIRIKTELHQVLRRDELYFCYQPIINSSDNSIFAVEALLRWDSRTLGSVAPDQIIAIAEETGLIVPLGYWILRKVCRNIKEWQAANSNIKIAINVSALQLKQKDFVDQVAAILKQEGVSPGLLIFEITESAFINDTALILSQLNRLNEMNIDCSLDDFGMGYSSLNYIRCFPFKSLKIDRVFIQQIETNKDDLSLVNGIVTMSRNLNLSVIAEGIETKVQYELLHAMGCDMVQGWYFSKALSHQELMLYLTKKRAEAV